MFYVGFGGVMPQDVPNLIQRFLLLTDERQHLPSGHEAWTFAASNTIVNPGKSFGRHRFVLISQRIAPPLGEQ